MLHWFPFLTTPPTLSVGVSAPIPVPSCPRTFQDAATAIEGLDSRLTPLTLPPLQ